MTLLEALQSGDFLDPNYGMVSNSAHNGVAPNCDNYWLFTAEAASLGYVPEKLNDFYRGCMIEPGLVHRYPGRTGDDISRDEMIGMAYLSEQFAKDILAYGSSHTWDFDVPNPGIFSLNFFDARFIDFSPFIQHCASQPLSIYDQILWSIGCVLSALSAYGDTSGKLIMLLEVERMKGSYSLCDFAIATWKWIMSRKYPGGPKELRKVYFGSHPLVDFSPNAF